MSPRMYVETKLIESRNQKSVSGRSVAGQREVKMRVTMKALDGERKGRGKGSKDDGGVRERGANGQVDVLSACAMSRDCEGARCEEEAGWCEGEGGWEREGERGMDRARGTRATVDDGRLTLRARGYVRGSGSVAK